MSEEPKPAGGKKVDEDWKKQAQAEKDRLKKQDEAQSEEPEEFVAEASLMTLISSFISQALIGLGEMPHPVTQERTPDLETAKFAIDMIQVLTDKTKGNLTEQEQKYIEAALYDLRLRFVAGLSPRPPAGEA